MYNEQELISRLFSNTFALLFDLFVDTYLMAKAKKKSKKKDTALLEQNERSLRRILKLYDQYSTEQSSVTCTEVTKLIRFSIEEGESLSKVKFFIFVKM